ncbi:Protein TolB [ANME-1 cluster archaeon GoMg1]|nr:Protein TolB [ANME-1 cluster archaeon GoMg1]
MKKQIAIAMVAILLLSALMVPVVISGNGNTTDMSKTNEDSTAKYVYERDMIISTTIANETNVSELELTIGIAATSDLVDKIAFHSNRDGDREIYVMDAGGTNVVQLTKNDATDMKPDWCAPSVPAEQVDLFFLVDGSGSIKSFEFQLQKEGLAYAINDSTVIPQDGSVSVCVIQFSDIAQIEIPLTTITSQSVANSISARIMAMHQFGGNTNMSGAFNVSIANFPSAPAKRQVIDLSTDGEPNVGGGESGTMSARDAALTAGFDEVNAIGVGLTPGGSAEVFLQGLVKTHGFYMRATDFKDFRDKIKDKIEREVSPPKLTDPEVSPETGGVEGDVFTFKVTFNRVIKYFTKPEQLPFCDPCNGIEIDSKNGKEWYEIECQHPRKAVDSEDDTHVVWMFRYTQQKGYKGKENCWASPWMIGYAEIAPDGNLKAANVVSDWWYCWWEEFDWWEECDYGAMYPSIALDSDDNAHVVWVDSMIPDSQLCCIHGSNESGGLIGLISQDTQLESITSILDEIGVNYDVLNYDGSNGNYTSNLTALTKYSTVIYYNHDFAITRGQHDALEEYLLNGGNLLVTGYDHLGSPDDPLLADIVRSSDYGDETGQNSFTVTNGSHPIMNGPYGNYPTGTSFILSETDHDEVEADTARGTTTVASLPSGYDKIIATELASGGKVVDWNGNRNCHDWTGDADLDNMLKNILNWFRIPTLNREVYYSKVQDETGLDLTVPDERVSNWNKRNSGRAVSPTVDDRKATYIEHPDIDVDRKDNVHIVWSELATRVMPWHWVVYYQMQDNLAYPTVLIDDTQISKGDTSDSMSPVIAADPKKGKPLHVHIAWQDERDVAGNGANWEIWYEKINPYAVPLNGARISDAPPFVVIDDTMVSSCGKDNGNNSAKPDIGIDLSGYVRITFMDDKSGQWEVYTLALHPNGNKQYEKRQSDMGGGTWSGKYRGPPDGCSMYPRIAVQGTWRRGTTHITWHDNRDGNWEIYYSEIANWCNNPEDDIRVTYDSRRDMYPDIALNTNGKPDLKWQKEVGEEISPGKYCTWNIYDSKWNDNQWIHVIIDGISYNMYPTDGITYVWGTPLIAGNHNYEFLANDGTGEVRIGPFTLTVR